MRPLTESEIRGSFVNCTKGEAKRLNVPRDLDTRSWDDLDYLGWRDPQSPGRGYLVAEIDGRMVGVVLRVPDKRVGHTRKSMCSLCITMRTGGVALMVAPRAGKSGQQGNTVGTYVCDDLGCSAHIRSKQHAAPAGLAETISLEDRVARLRLNLAEFLGRVSRAEGSPG